MKHNKLSIFMMFAKPDKAQSLLSANLIFYIQQLCYKCHLYTVNVLLCITNAGDKEKFLDTTALL